MGIVAQRTWLRVEVSVDLYELERAVQEAFAAALGTEEVMAVHASQFPHEYGALVLLRHEPSAEAEAVAREVEERFRAADLRVGLLLRKARSEAH
jgi:hypothetical protein